MKRFFMGDEVICKVTGLSGHVFNVIPGTPEYYDVMWDNLSDSREPAKNLIYQGDTVKPPPVLTPV